MYEVERKAKSQVNYLFAIILTFLSRTHPLSPLQITIILVLKASTIVIWYFALYSVLLCSRGFQRFVPSLTNPFYCIFLVWHRAGQIRGFLLAMGSSASVHKDPKSAKKLRLVFASKTDKLVSPSPIKDKPLDNAEIKLPNPQSKPQPSPVLPVTSFSDHGTIFLLYLFSFYCWIGFLGFPFLCSLTYDTGFFVGFLMIKKGQENWCGSSIFEFVWCCATSLLRELLVLKKIYLFFSFMFKKIMEMFCLIWMTRLTGWFLV